MRRWWEREKWWWSLWRRRWSCLSHWCCGSLHLPSLFLLLEREEVPCRSRRAPCTGRPCLRHTYRRQEGRRTHPCRAHQEVGTRHRCPCRACTCRRCRTRAPRCRPYHSPRPGNTHPPRPPRSSLGAQVACTRCRGTEAEGNTQTTLASLSFPCSQVFGHPHRHCHWHYRLFVCRRS